jgi:cytidyltransferase-like protein
LADGCFDPLHSGHIEHLKAASKLGSHLIVNTNPDSIIWKKRPKVGPFLTKNNRKEFIHSFPFVDTVTNLPIVEAINKIRPDIYVQGKDWKDRLPKNEISICKKLKIKIQFTDIRTNSSSNMLERFINQYNKINNSQGNNIYG